MKSSVSDLSLDGCCLTGCFLVGERIEVTIPRIGRHSAEIRWALVGRAGARFIRSVAPAASV